MPTALRSLVEYSSYFGNNIPLILIASASFLVYFLSKGYLKESVLFVMANASYLLSVVLKNIFKTPRPLTYNGNPMKPGDLYAFPSSHVMFYVCFWGFLLYLSSQKSIFPNSYVANIVRFISVYHIIFVGASRVIAGAHTISDVIAGYIFGLVFLGILIALERH